MTQPVTKPPARPGRILPFLAGLGFTLGGLGALWFLAYCVLSSVKARGWTSHPCTIDSMFVQVSRSTRGRVSRELHASYSWEWQELKHYSNRIAFSPETFSFSRLEQTEELGRAEGVPNGFRCWVNPRDPTEAVLYRDVRWEFVLFFAPIAVFFPAFGAGLMLSALRGFPRQRREALAKASWPDEPLHWREDWSQGRVEEHGMWFSEGGRLGPAWAIPVVVAALASLFVTSEWSGGRLITAAVFGTGLALLVGWTVQKARCMEKFGRLEFLPDALPITPGQPLTGTVPLRRPLRRSHGIKATILVSHTVAKGKSLRNKKDTTNVTATVGPGGIVLSALLPDLPPAYSADATVKARWILILKAPGNSIHTRFELPVQAFH